MSIARLIFAFGLFAGMDAFAVENAQPVPQTADEIKQKIDSVENKGANEKLDFLVKLQVESTKALQNLPGGLVGAYTDVLKYLTEKIMVVLQDFEKIGFVAVVLPNGSVSLIKKSDLENMSGYEGKVFDPYNIDPKLYEFIKASAK